ncbi:MAG: hypothetical protein JWO09_1464 [Bacteroidetes bacterium]|nr:hypothetical protein [Bacteroidota bacterium]
MINPDYNLLPINEKAEMLWQDGKFIEAMELNDFDVSLYSLNDQYVEMYYSVSKSRIEKITVVQDPERLLLYKEAN